jgi:hypothetical protein
VVSRKIGFRYSALRVGDKAMNNPNVTQETTSDPADVLLEHDWRRDEKNESTKRLLKNESPKKWKIKVSLLA